MKHYSSLEEIKAYFERPEVDQSRLKRLILGLEGFLDDRESKLYFEEKESFIIGSLVDCKITNREEDFDKQYHISTLIEKPSDTLKSIINYVYDKSLELSTDEETWKNSQLSDYRDLILESINLHNYQPTYKEQTKIDKVVACSAYFNDLQLSAGKQVVSLEEYSVAETVSQSLVTIPIIEGCIRDYPESSVEFNEFDVYFQLPIYFTYKGVKCKALLDILIVDKVNNEYWIIDLKTMAGRTSDFFNSVMKYRYDIQISFYREAVMSKFGIGKEKTTCLFAVESTIRPGTPIAFACNEALLTQGEMGRGPIALGDVVLRQEIKGFSQLIDTYLYHESKGFVEDKIAEVAREKGLLTLGVNGIVEQI